MNSQEWLSELIAFDTTSRHSNINLIMKIRDWLSHHGITSHLTYDPTHEKANIFATIPGSDESLNGGLLLSGHTDVVPVDGQQWDTDPFHAIMKDQRIYGRGACDMKGFIAIALSLIPSFLKFKLKKPLHFAFSYDEETGCLGAPLLIEDFIQKKIKPAACIVGEPTNTRLIVAHKGIQVFRCRFHGHAMHSSLTTQGCNSIEHASQFISWLRQLAAHLTKAGPHDSHYDVPFTSVTTNLINGGIATNIIPSFCELFFEFRNIPEMDPNTLITKIKTYLNEDLLPIMHREYPDASIEFDILGSVPAFEATMDAFITQLISRINNDSAIHKVSYATEAGLFQRAGIPTVVCGPGSIDEAHRPNEFITLEQMNKYETFLQQLVLQFNENDKILAQ